MVKKRMFSFIKPVFKYEDINEGYKVEFEITRGEKGAKAENVKKI